MTTCFHCGDPCLDKEIKSGNHIFCCQGCKTVYEILHENDLSYYYDLEKNPGISPGEIEGKFDFLDNREISDKLMEFNDGKTAVISFSIPSIHCSSCIWILENLHKINPAIKSAQVNFPKKTARITFTTDSSEEEKTTSLKELVLLLSRIGYEPYISLEDADKQEKNANRSIIFKLTIAGFAFANIMSLSLPEYLSTVDFSLDQFKPFFRWIMFGLSLPVVFYSASGYFKSAYSGLRSGLLNIDVPLALGIAALFIQSTIDIIFDFGTGYFDSLTGLVFFLLLGKFFQQKTYSYLSFERDYKSYFPLGVTRLIKNENDEIIEEQIEVKSVEKGDRLLIKNNEIIPVDGILLKGNALIDYSFVTGEAEPIPKNSGDKLFAGGKQQAGIIEVEVLKPVEASYLTQLWSNEVFHENDQSIFQNLTDKISRNFTIGILSIAIISTLIWLFLDSSKAFFVFTSVLIIACPCAIALAAPFTLGNSLRIFGRNKLYLKEAAVIEKMAQIDTVVFDKTGTMTTSQKNKIDYYGKDLTSVEMELLSGTLRASNHPLSRALYRNLQQKSIRYLENFEEIIGKGMTASYQDLQIKVGSFSFVSEGLKLENPSFDYSLETLNKTSVHIRINQEYKGYYVFNSEYRKGITDIFQDLSTRKKVIVLSGDNEGEREILEKILPKETDMYFNQKPDDKLNFIKELQQNNRKVMMIGDGLNDAGALKQSDVGIVVSENTNVFTPACDGILDAEKIEEIPAYFNFSKESIQIIKWAFIFSLMYNLIGVSFAVTGHLRPVVAAILMPLSSISIVTFTTLASQLKGKKFKEEKEPVQSISEQHQFT